MKDNTVKSIAQIKHQSIEEIKYSGMFKKVFSQNTPKHDKPIGFIKPQSIRLS